jgi:hypothetical protein
VRVDRHDGTVAANRAAIAREQPFATSRRRSLTNIENASIVDAYIINRTYLISLRLVILGRVIVDSIYMGVKFKVLHVFAQV